MGLGEGQPGLGQVSGVPALQGSDQPLAPAFLQQTCVEGIAVRQLHLFPYEFAQGQHPDAPPIHVVNAKITW